MITARYVSVLCKPKTASRFAATLAFLEHQHSLFNPASLSALTAACSLKHPVTVLVTGSQAGNIAKQAVNLEGVAKILCVEDSQYDKGLPENLANLLVQVIKTGNFSHVFSAHSATGKNVMPRVSALLDVQQLSDITAILDDNTFTRPIYAGNAILTTQSQDPIKVITVRATSFTAAKPGDSQASVEHIQSPQSSQQSEWISENLAFTERPDLGSASRVVSGGRAVKTKDNFDKVIVPLADALGAAIGASRAAVDAGYADNSLQVGQTGKIVAPELYIAVGISGAIQHLAGMKDSKTIVAINKDADAPIFQISLPIPYIHVACTDLEYVADFGLVADLFEAVPELTEKLKS
ncbi:putative electron transfer flavoprotein subunit alpha, mitochondrial [Neolecta irregularis DAH-3]|uniref:Probable electron transfer flavoprotein subunit alpha n=1 Tax=Neolecta irregularis (strain DAH-3) TaxID=1198029 RepID=A0A1U7LRM0_NEOID|nr:putative electron transfer flavoprotein subunit alpha, mitochondrial [Neolecta irregularis DAH-3]|eukprot:OLL25320.1 putative electron transfer flavoprotein subunit alpha, mitochondrial [Neolecta irregularis DAH-3]